MSTNPINQLHEQARAEFYATDDLKIRQTVDSNAEFQQIFAGLQDLAAVNSAVTVQPIDYMTHNTWQYEHNDALGMIRTSIPYSTPEGLPRQGLTFVLTHDKLLLGNDRGYAGDYAEYRLDQVDAHVVATILRNVTRLSLQAAISGDKARPSFAQASDELGIDWSW